MNSKVVIRKHYFYATVSENVFWHPEKGIVFAPEPLSVQNIAKFELKPLILYALAVPGTSVSWLTFSLLESPRSLSEVIAEGWQKARHLRGYPDQLIVSRHIAHGCKDLQKSLSLMDEQIKLIVANDSDVSFNAVFDMVLKSVFDSLDFNTTLSSLDDLNIAAENQHFKSVKDQLKSLSFTPSALAILKDHLALPFRPPLAIAAPLKLDWIIYQSRYSAYSKEIEPDQFCYFHFVHTTKTHGHYWLLVDHDDEFSRLDSVIEVNNEMADEIENEVAYFHYYGLLVDLVLNCWPTELKEFTKTIGISKARFDRFCNGAILLNNSINFKISSLLSIEYNVEKIEYEIAGPLALIIEDPEINILTYEYMIQEDRMDYCMEVIPHRGAPDIQWRYVVFASSGRLPSVLMFKRATPAFKRIKEKIDDQLLVGYQGIAKISPDIYRDIMMTCRQCCTDSSLNRVLMTRLGSDHQAYLMGVSEQI